MTHELFLPIDEDKIIKDINHACIRRDYTEFHAKGPDLTFLLDK